jgi:acetylglutamate kinase
MTGPLVVKLGGRALDEAPALPDLWQALATMAREAPGGLVLVHGGGSAVDAHLGRLGLASERRAGLRVTPETHIGEVVGVLRGRVNALLVGLLASRGVGAVGLGLSDGLACRCVKHEPGGEDFGRVGVVQTDHPGEGRLWRTLLDAGCVPVLCSIGMDGAGRPLNINADDAAMAVASILRAQALVLLTDVPGVLDERGAPVERTDEAGVEALIARGVISGGMIPKARAAAAAARASGVPTVIASWASPPGVLAGLARGEPVGTRVMPGSPAPAAR